MKLNDAEKSELLRCWTTNSAPSCSKLKAKFYRLGLSTHPMGPCTLTASGRIYANLITENEKLRAALVQANETAELLYRAVDRQLMGVSDKVEYETMRANLKEILG